MLIVQVYRSTLDHDEETEKMCGAIAEEGINHYYGRFMLEPMGQKK